MDPDRPGSAPTFREYPGTLDVCGWLPAIDGATAAGGGVVKIGATASSTIEINRLVLRSNVILDGGGTTFVVVASAIQAGDRNIDFHHNDWDTMR